jgi:hypothetical protein
MGGLFAATSDRLLYATGKLASRAYHLVFGKLDERAVQRGDLRLARDVSREWVGLLQEHSGQVQVSSIPRRSSFDYAMVRVIFPGFFLEVTRGRGELRVRVSPKAELYKWEDLSLVVRSLESVQQVRADMTLSQLGSVLTEHWGAIAAKMQ